MFGRVQGFADPAGGGYAGGLSFWTNPGGSAGTASTEKVRIQYNGNVGIGTTGPGALLDVADGSIRFSSTSNYSAVRDIGPIYFRSKDSEGTPFNVGSIRGYQSGSALGGIRGYYYSAGDQLGFELTTDSNFVVNTGNLGIGTTGPGAKLVVAASLGAGDYNWLTFRNLQSGYGTWGFVKKSNNDLAINYGVNSDTPTAGTSLYLQYGGNVGIGTTNPQRKLEVNGSIRMGALITGAGTAVAVYRDVNGDLADSTSSIRYKDEVIPYESVLDRVLSLQAVRFNWGQNTSTPGLGDFGMIAEQVNTYLPDLVTYEADGVTPHGLKYEKMGVFAIKAIQEQQVKLTALSIGITDKIDNISQLKEVEKSFTDKAATLSAKLASMESRLAFIEDNVLGASSSATLSGQLAQLNGLLATDKVATLSALTVTGRTNLNDLGVIGTISAGTLIIDGADNSINSLTDTLKIQPSALAGVDFLGGKVTIDQKGNMKVEAEITAKKYNVQVGDTAAASIGEAVIPAGETKIKIKTTSLTSVSKIFVEPIDQPVATSVSRIDDTTFEIRIKESLDQELKLNWWIVN
ncbi:hypothetical protein A3F03_04340 [Candidatus Roizmanbacteria bacterium RIFCSPHIGHO2_12_FULL_41_11]|uniref:Peptidase S74 domain-containing protein n=1 Tax=Candidatus Roizmanbacteria bacterium RIFCSPHIGHO2_12_FULL_41_11 TaxID=1802052 RepID=A0A1F7I1R2_9BACT|nr:MAG: hypothetical protein A3F03_04340 [Candidatus Roizmanbacteria bacterium RIFCSPHIGHO2_12_FULL_41_11]